MSETLTTENDSTARLDRSEERTSYVVLLLLPVLTGLLISGCEASPLIASPIAVGTNALGFAFALRLRWYGHHRLVATAFLTLYGLLTGLAVASTVFWIVESIRT